MYSDVSSAGTHGLQHESMLRSNCASNRYFIPETWPPSIGFAHLIPRWGDPAYALSAIRE
ncbi:unnamed protein product [Fusarium venenatum]|uniref:Uncharacterized protein n=1 Tax=Fusarium venenatum TaxID=56646 RepID=A0A2L2TKR0_9HYPO|nr:uncharacterized protein FVRRES_05336 [Fusarium venenatum]CEI60900.1 unnamed protein product [Fusarium venenatum]